MTDVNSIGTAASQNAAQLSGQSGDARSDRQQGARAPQDSSSTVTVSVAAQQRLAAEQVRSEATGVVPDGPANGLQQRIDALVGAQSTTVAPPSTAAASAQAESPVAAGQASLRESTASARADATSRDEPQQQPTATDPSRSDNGTDLTA